MEINFENILVDSLNDVINRLDCVVSYDAQVHFEKVIEAKTIVKQILQLIYLKNVKTNRDKDGSHGVNPNIK